MPKQSVAREVRRSTKIHGVVDGCGRPVALRITPEQRGGAPVAIPLLEPLPRTRLCAAETADDSDALRDFLATRGMQPVIPSNPTRKRIRPNFAEVKPDDLDWMHDLMELNYWGSVWPIHAALPYLAASRGRIVAVSSVAGLIGVPGRTAYSGTKFALSGFCEALRAELAPSGISVTIVYPGVVKTDIRKVGYGASGAALGTSGVREDDIMPVEEAVRLMLAGVQARKREVLMTRQMRLGRWLKLIAPTLVDRMVLKAIKPEFRPKPITPAE